MAASIYGLGFLSVIAFTLGGCDDNRVEWVGSVSSPDRQAVVNIYVSEGGGTTDTSHFLELALPGDARGRDASQIVISKTFSLHDFRVDWLNNSDVQISCTARDIFRSQTQVTLPDGRVIHVSFKEL
jgi:hypothetical protein